MKQLRYSCCQVYTKIVYEDWLSKWAFENKRPFIKLCYTCCKEQFPDQLPEEINNLLILCECCKEKFLPPKITDIFCIDCKKKKLKPKSKVKIIGIYKREKAQKILMEFDK